MNSSQEDLLLTPLSTQESPNQNPKIPRGKPHYRYADYDRLNRAQHIRAKLWKLHSCKFVDFHGGFSTFEGNYYEQIAKNRAMLQLFQETIKHPTLKKCLKHVRKIAFRQDLLPKNQFFLRLCTHWRLNSLSLTFNPNAKPLKMIKGFLNSKLKHCFLSYRDFSINQSFESQVISIFRRMKKCQLVFRSESNKTGMVLKTDNLHSYSKLCQFIRLHLKPKLPENSEDVLIPPDSLEQISYHCSSENQQVSGLPFFPNLQKLNWTFINQDNNTIPVDLSFIQQYPRLQSLTIFLDHAENETLNFLADLPNLKEFHFSPIRSCLKNGLPTLSKLEKFSLNSDEQTILNTDHIRDFLEKNKNLKTLNLTLSIQKIAAILKNNPCLYHIEALGLHFRRSETQDIDAANIIAYSLRTHHSIRELSIGLEYNFPGTDNILLKEGLAQMRFLERLKVKFLWRKVGFSQKVKFPHLPDIFTDLKNLKSLDLDIPPQTYLVESIELSSILDGLSQLESLKEFRFVAKLSQLSSPVFRKLLNFLISIRHLNNLHLNLRGFSEEYERILRESFFPKSTLGQGTISFSYH